MKRTIWLQFIVLIALSAAVLIDEHIIAHQAAQLRRADTAVIAAANEMTQARQALRVQGDALDECMRVAVPPLAPRREGVRL